VRVSGAERFHDVTLPAGRSIVLFLRLLAGASDK